MRWPRLSPLGSNVVMFYSKLRELSSKVPFASLHARRLGSSGHSVSVTAHRRGGGLPRLKAWGLIWPFVAQALAGLSTSVGERRSGLSERACAVRGQV